MDHLAVCLQELLTQAEQLAGDGRYSGERDVYAVRHIWWHIW